jgi:peptidoglycan/xylan/chitin deacetylase (PgdA/CDA1 family)
MSKNPAILLAIGISVLAILLSGCSIGAKANIQAQSPVLSPPSIEPNTTSPTPFQAITYTPMVIPPTYTPSPTFTPRPTSTPSPTDTPLPTDTPIPTDTAEPVWNPGGDVIAPILLYHHVSDANAGNRYYLSPQVFRAQLQALRDWGYTSITVSQMVSVLINGGELPARPVVITFDDGNIDIYQNAFPIMQELGFVGTFYIVGNRLQSKYYVNAEQLQEMTKAGWEIGCHGMSHIDLTKDHSVVGYEMATSRSVLEDALGVPIQTFAYPYGVIDDFVTTKVSEYRYLAGMGLGTSWEHTWGSIFYLSRIEVQSSYDMVKFASLLPWSG